MCVRDAMCNIFENVEKMWVCVLLAASHIMMIITRIQAVTK